MTRSETTEFAPAARTLPDALARQAAYFAQPHPFLELMDYLPDMVLILNAERQVVYANKAALQGAHCADRTLAVGMRPGELFGCKHGHETQPGCGTTQFCSCCGAVRAVLQGQAGRSAIEECRLTVSGDQGDSSLDLRIWASPIDFQGEKFTFFVAADIGDEKRREFLERIFLHDVTNTAMTLQAVSLLLTTQGMTTQPQKAAGQQEHVRHIRALADQLLDQLDAQRQLIAAENGELQLRVAPVRSLELLEDVAGVYRRQPVMEGRRLRISDDSVDILFQSDRRLLSRVLRNMLKNALEATTPGETATLGCRLDGDNIVFWTHNRTYMPENVRLQIFNRSFSTKGAGRGLGTYSMKFLSERYLRGTLAFVSTEEEGTTFYASYPIAISAVAR